jgi:putative transposase
VVDFVFSWSELTGLSVSRLVGWIGIGRDKFYEWRGRYGEENRHNGLIPRDFWIEEWERVAIIEFYYEHPGEGYRRLTYLMIDRDIVAVSPSTTYGGLKAAGGLRLRGSGESKKGSGFEQPGKAHEHWHVDISYLNIRGTFYYFCGVLDGFSRYIVHWDIRESMKEADVEIVIQRAREKYAEARPRIISDNGPQFIAREFKEFVRFSGMTHVRTSPYYPESNGKIERFHQSLKRECIRPKTPVSLDDARRVVAEFVDEYNNERLHGGIGYVTPRDKLQGRAPAIHRERKRKLEEAQRRRKENYEKERVADPRGLDREKALVETAVNR